MSLDELTNKVTAFRTYAELCKACADGYVPSLFPYQGNSDSIRRANSERRELCFYLKNSGFRVWVG